MASIALVDSPYEASDEASESELLDQSLSVWKGWGCIANEAFVPIPLDLHTASSIGQYECVRNIIQKGEEDPNRQNKGGWTPLMYACYIGHDNIVNLLLDARVNVNVKNHKGQSPLTLAASCGNESVTYFLLQAGADLEARDNKGWTALFHATYSGHQNMVKFLLESGADAETREPRNGFTPFMEAAASGHEIIVQYFLQHGVDVEHKAFSGHTARSIALDNGLTKIVSLIDNHMLSPSVPLRSDAGLTLEGDLSSSDEGRQAGRRPNYRGRGRYKGPSIRDGPDAFNKVFQAKKKGMKGQGQGQSDTMGVQEGVVPQGYMTFPSDDVAGNHDNQIRFRDVTSPIGPEDHRLDSSGGKSELTNSLDTEDDTNAFTKTGALTIKSSSGSSGGLVAALGLSRDNSISDSEEKESPTSEKSTNQNDSGHPGTLHRSMSDSLLKGFENLRAEEERKSQGKQASDHQSPHQTLDAYNRAMRESGFPQQIPQQFGEFPGQYSQFQLFPEQQQQQQQQMMMMGDQNQLPPNYPLSMLQHPMWQHFGYNMAATSAATPGAVTNPPQYQPHQINNPPNRNQKQQKPGLEAKKEGFESTNKEPKQDKPPTNQSDPRKTSQNPPNQSDLRKPSQNPPNQSDPRKPGKNPSSQSEGKKGLSAAAKAEMVEVVTSRPHDLHGLLEELGLAKYQLTFDEQDVDLQVFLSLTDNDLKEVGIKLFGPRRKMTNAIARWHSNARPSRHDLEQAYADKLEADMQEMAIQLKLAKEEVSTVKAAVQQEHELRTVTESCLVRDRVTWQQVHSVAGEAHRGCVGARERLQALRLYHQELSKRLGLTPQACLAGSGGHDSLTAALKEGLSLEENRQPIPHEISNLPTKHLILHLDKMTRDLEGMVAIATVGVSKVLEASPSALQGLT